MGQTQPKYFLPEAPYGASPAANTLNPTQPGATNPQVPLLPPNFQDPGTTMQGTPGAAQNMQSPAQGRHAPNDPVNYRKLLQGLFAFLLLLFAPSVWATTTVTGKIQNLVATNLTSGTFVRFWLRGCAGNQPRVNGTAIIGPSQGGVFFVDLSADASGNISGTLYSTRDAAGTGNGEIECGGSKTAVWYGMQAFVAGKGGPEIPVHAKNSVTLDITQAVPISSTPVVTAPSGDSTYLRLDAANSPFAGNYSWTGNETHSGTETYTNGILTNALTDSGLTTGNCVQATTGGLLATVGGPCGSSSGTVTPTGSPVASELTCFSGATSITNCNLSGDVSTTNTAVTTLAASIPSAHSFSGTVTLASPVINGTPTGTGLQGTDTKVLTSGTVSGTGVALCTDANAGATTSGCPSPGGFKVENANTTPVTISNNSTEQTLMTFTLGANELSGTQTLDILARGNFSNSFGSSKVCTLRLYLDGNVISRPVPVTVATGLTVGWKIQGSYMLVTGGAGGTIEAQADLFWDTQVTVNVLLSANAATFAFDTTATHTIKVTTQMNTADPSIATQQRQMLILRIG